MVWRQGELFGAMAGTALVRFEERNPQNAKKTVCPPGTQDARHEELSDAIVTRPLVRLEESTPQSSGARGVRIRHVWANGRRGCRP